MRFDQLYVNIDYYYQLKTLQVKQEVLPMNCVDKEQAKEKIVDHTFVCLFFAV